VGLIDDGEVPADLGELGGLRRGELVGAEECSRIEAEGVGGTLPNQLLPALAVEDAAAEVKLLQQLLLPLLA
jgi:hypothetical protein